MPDRVIRASIFSSDTLETGISHFKDVIKCLGLRPTIQWPAIQRP